MPWAPAAAEPAFYDATTVGFPVFKDWKYFEPTNSIWPNVKINFLDSVTTYCLKLYAQEAAQEKRKQNTNWRRYMHLISIAALFTIAKI